MLTFFTLQSITDFEDVFRHIRWSLLSRAQVESLLSSPEYDHLQEVLQEVAAEPGLHEPRGWPQELLLVSSNGAALTFQFYNFKRKSWRTEAGPRLGEGAGVAGLVEEGHSLVMTQTNPEGSSTPVSVSQYNLWTQQWTIPATTQRTPVKVRQFQHQHIDDYGDEDDDNVDCVDTVDDDYNYDVDYVDDDDGDDDDDDKDDDTGTLSSR